MAQTDRCAPYNQASDGTTRGRANLSEPIARYYEVRPSGRRQFELLADRVIVETKSIRIEAVMTVMLADLRPEPNILRIRPKEFNVGLTFLLAAVGFGFYGFLAHAPAPPADDRSILWFALAAGCLLASLVVFSKTFQKIEYMQFVSHQGKPLLDVARAGPQRADFDQFVETLIDQIEASQKT
jgi:hypothetical protein